MSVIHRQQKSISHSDTTQIRTIQQKKETLEKFLYCNSSQLFSNQIFDMKGFIKQNYIRYCDLLDQNEQLRLQIIQRKPIKKREIPEITQLKLRIEEKQKINTDLLNKLNQVQRDCKKQDFFNEYQQILKEVEELRCVNAQL
ncbi:hypothetical protein pb186bvf_016583 [Paramecium bursaria]